MRLQLEVVGFRNAPPPKELLSSLRRCQGVSRVHVRALETPAHGISASSIRVLYCSPVALNEWSAELEGMYLDRQPVVLASEDSDVALLGFQVGAADFVHLPAAPARFEVALQHAAERMTDLSQRLEGLLRGLCHSMAPAGSLDSLVIESGNAMIFIPLDDIRWVELKRNTARIHTSERTYSKRVSLTQLERRLPENFWRLHRSAIVNAHCLKRIDSDRGATSYAILDDGTRVEVSRRHRIRQIRPLLV